MAKTKEKEHEVWTVGVACESQCYDNGDGEDSNEPYSYRGTTSTSWDTPSLYLLDSDDKRKYMDLRETVDIGFKPVKGQLYHLLYAVYSTGDSFGHDNGRCFEVIGLYENRGVAEENEKRLWEGKPSKKGKWGSETVLLKAEGTAKLHEYYAPWNGYFESLDSLQVLSLFLN